jgi:hypothetical protein
MKTKALALLVACCLLPSWSTAQSSCAAVYAGATSNMTATERDSAKYDYAFSRHCESNGTVKSSSQSQDLSVEIPDYVEFGWKGSQAEALQVMQKFCKTQQASYASADRYRSLTNTVVVAALNSFNQCIALERNGINMTHTSNATAVVISGNFDPSKTRVEVQSVRYDATAGRCETTSISPPKVTRVSDKMNAFRPRRAFTISCGRIGTATQSGETKYPRFEILVATNYGAYSVTMLPEDVQGYDLASESRRLVARAEAQVQALRGEMAQNIAAEQTKTAAALSRRAILYNYVQGDGWAVPCPAPQNRPTALEYMTQICGARELQPPGPNSGAGIASGGGCGVTAVAFACIDR